MSNSKKINGRKILKESSIAKIYPTWYIDSVHYSVSDHRAICLLWATFIVLSLLVSFSLIDCFSTIAKIW